MPTETDRVNERYGYAHLLAALTSAPLLLSFDDARKAISNGTAIAMLESSAEGEKILTRETEAELTRLRAAQPFNGIIPTDPEGKDRLIKALAERVNVQAAIMSRAAEKAATPLAEPGTTEALMFGAHPEFNNRMSATAPTAKAGEYLGELLGKPMRAVETLGKLGEMNFLPLSAMKPFARLTEASTEGRSEPATEENTRRVTVPAQNSEPTSRKASEPDGLPRFFVCTVCLNGFMCETGESVSCQCGAARVSHSGLLPGVPCLSGPVEEVTALVRCGKLTASLPNQPTDEHPCFALFALHNRPARNVQQRSAVAISQAAGEGIRAGTQAAFGYIGKAAEAGARVLFHSHYHARACGVDRAPNGDFLRRETTGDARFCAQVIVRDQKNEADGSLLFYPVHGCARCGKDHAAPVAFWKLTHPVWMPTMSVQGGCTASVLVATHFGYCPENGEPIMMVSDAGTDTDGFALAEAAANDFTKPAAGGKVETMRDINGTDPIPAARSAPLAAVGNTSHPPTYEEGWLAADTGKTSTSNPYPSGSQDAGEWNRGFRDRSAT